MKKLTPVLMILSMMASLLVTTASAAPTAMLTQTAELGQLKVCKVAGSGVTQGTLFNFRVDGSSYSVPAGPVDRNGYCILAGQYPVNSEVTIEEVIPTGYYVSRIEVKPDRTVSKDTPRGIVTVRIVSGVIEAIFTNKVAGPPTPTRTPTSVHTSTPRPTRTPPSCDPNCTATPTSIPMGRLQICKEAEGPGVTGSFTFRFETRSRTVPVGTCAGLIAIEAGTLTITETAQAGYSVVDIYTIPADRLIDKNLATGVATVRILEGMAASQTIVIFRNRRMPPTTTFTPTSTGTITQTATYTPTFTPTFTSTPTPTETACISADFTKVGVGDSVQGWNTVAQDLNIVAKRDARRVVELQPPQSYQAPNILQSISNGWVAADGGFSDLDTRNAQAPHLYTFTFDVSIRDFYLHMLDFGDWNPTRSANHYASMTAYDVNGNVVSQHELSYTTPRDEYPEDLFVTGDAFARLGEPGNWIWKVAGNGIMKVVLEFGEGHDPDIAFDLLSFTTECAGCPPEFISANFSNIPAGQSVEGMGRVAPYLNIDAKGTALRVVEANDPVIYLSPNGLQTIVGIVNGGLAADGGFSDLDTRNPQEPHLYTFTFAPGVSITNFSLHMLDFGDWNPTRSINHYASMTAYDANGLEIPNAKQVLSYTTPPDESPRASSLYGDLFFTGDALNAIPGQPGNWVWNISGNGIMKVVLEFGEGHDPNVAFDLLSFTTECAGCPPEFISANFSSIPAGQSVEGMGRVAPYLNIDAKGIALHVVQDGLPQVYLAPNGASQTNGGLGFGGGFSDIPTKDKLEPHLYTFYFDVDKPITNFSLHMLDFGDWNHNTKRFHRAIMIAYDAHVNGNVVSTQELSYETLPVPGPRWSDPYGNLRASGDALSARPGEPGNWVWNIVGNGILRVELRFGYEVGGDMQNGYDPNIAFDSLSFCPE
jgi:hypothetical protein